jgi:sugar phosphate isomerase/epimerase
VRTLTLGFLNCPEATPLALVDIAADAGFTSVGLRITGRRVGDPYTEVIGNAGMIADIRERLRDRGVALSNISAYHLYPDVGLRELVPLLETVRALGSTTALCSCYDTDHARFARMLSGYADAAAALDIRLAFEFVPFSEAKSLEAAIGIVRRVDRPNVGLVIDPLHLARSDGRPEDLRSVPPERFFFAQLCDAPAERPAGVELATEARMQRLDPGTAGLRMADVLRELPPGLELECEFPTLANLRLPPPQRARVIHDAAERFLQRYDPQRDTRT